MISNETHEIIEEPFGSFLQKYQKGLEESMKASEFVFDSVDPLYHKCRQVRLNCSKSYMDSMKWLKNKKKKSKYKP